VIAGLVVFALTMALFVLIAVDILLLALPGKRWRDR
jgi:hypothetical protein